MWVKLLIAEWYKPFAAVSSFMKLGQELAGKLREYG
jgi:hypothetical protein